MLRLYFWVCAALVIIVSEAFAAPAKIPFVLTDGRGVVTAQGGECSHQELFQLVQFATQHRSVSSLDQESLKEEVRDYCGVSSVTVKVGG